MKAKEVIKFHHDKQSESLNVYFEQDGKPIDISIDLGEAYQESAAYDKTQETLTLIETFLKASGR